MSLSVLIVLGLLGVFLMIRGRQREDREASAVDEDAVLLEQLAEAGADPTRPHRIEFFLYLPGRAEADQVAAVLVGEGFTTEVREEPGSLWCCLAARTMRPELDSLHACRSRLSALAESRGGAYDGWGTEVERG